MSMKKSSDTIRNRTRELPVFCAVLQTAPSRAQHVVLQRIKPDIYHIHLYVNFVRKNVVNRRYITRIYFSYTCIYNILCGRNVEYLNIKTIGRMSLAM